MTAHPSCSGQNVNSLQALRDLVVAEENLVCSSRDEFLLKFLRAKKFDYEKSFKMVQRYCAMRSRSPQNFSKSLPSLAKDTLDCQLQTVLPHRDGLARRVLIFRVGKWNTVTTTPEEIFRNFSKLWSSSQMFSFQLTLKLNLILPCYNLLNCIEIISSIVWKSLVPTLCA